MERFNEKAGSSGSQQIKKSPQESDKGIQFNLPKDASIGIIKVVGVGGGGCNAVRNMYLEGITNVTYLACNTDSQHLVRCPVPVKLQLGIDGLGAGGNPDKGREEAELTRDRIRQQLSDGTKMVFVTASMGGGTGTGAGPIVAQVAKEMGILTIGIVTIPFSFEGKQKILKALRGMEEMRKSVDALLVVQNDKLTGGPFRELSDGERQRVPMRDQFKAADDILKDAAKSISELITMHTDGDINLDFRDVETTMKNGGDAIMAAGRASGEHRVERAIIQALDSPLLYGSDIGRARRILFDIYTSDDEPLYMDEMQEIEDFMHQLDPNIDVIWGTSTDNTLGKDAKVIILAAGMAHEMQTETPSPTPVIKDDDYFLSLMHQLYEKPKAPVKSVLQPELAFVEESKDSVTPSIPDSVSPEPVPGSAIPEPVSDSVDPSPVVPEPTPRKPTFLQKAWAWLSRLTTEE
ncbi:MAG: cell division protein FtsZ [Bacteroidaceae bacterium]|nr:cell division protein FtsZ [Bacteroidaceae bacterium]